MEDQISAAQKLINTLIEFFVNYSFQVVGAIIILVVGYVLASWTSALILKLSTSRKIDIPPSSAVNLEILKGMQDSGINIPFPQREIRIVSQPSTVKSLS